MLRYLFEHREVYDVLETRSSTLTAGPFPGATVNRVGSMFTIFFTDQPVTSWDSAKTADTASFKNFFHFMLEHGVYMAPSQFEAAFVSNAHTEEDVRTTAAAASEFFNARA
jgi:glutamate-1-semialdehyde 2,1-aminomutase